MQLKRCRCVYSTQTRCRFIKFYCGCFFSFLYTFGNDTPFHQHWKRACMHIRGVYIQSVRRNNKNKTLEFWMHSTETNRCQSDGLFKWCSFSWHFAEAFQSVSLHPAPNIFLVCNYCSFLPIALFTQTDSHTHTHTHTHSHIQTIWLHLMRFRHPALTFRARRQNGNAIQNAVYGHDVMWKSNNILVQRGICTNYENTASISSAGNAKICLPF